MYNLLDTDAFMFNILLRSFTKIAFYVLAVHSVFEKVIIYILENAFLIPLGGL